MTAANTDPRPDETDNARDDIPNPETGVGIGADAQPDTFEPEENPEQS
jgi:hypothetical protein